MLLPTPNARSSSTRCDRQRECRHLANTVRGAIGCIAEEVRALDRRIEQLVTKMPDDTATFDVLGELGAGLRCVQHDLLADAIETLEALVTLDEAGLRQRFEERRLRLVAEGE